LQHNRVFRTLALALIFALLVLPLLATPALAVVTPTITLSPTSGVPGATVTVTGIDFDAYNSRTIYVLFDHNPTYQHTTVTNNGFTIAFTVPTTATPGIKHVTIQLDEPTYPPSQPELATSTFTVLTCQVTISPSGGYVGDTVTVDGTGFEANSSVSIYFDSTSVQTVQSDATGSFNDKTFTVPPSYRGNHTVKGKDANNDSPTVNFAVSQKITTTPTGGAPGLPVTVNGTGFDHDKTVTIKYNAVAVTTTPATVSTDTNGSFSASFIVPSSVSGSYTVQASDGTNSASTNFAITINVTLSQTTSEASPGHVGMEITFSGTGFKPNSQIKVTYTSTTITVATVTSDNEGAFSATFDIPKSEHGAHVIAASDGSSTLQATFFMEQTAPAVPKLLVPTSGEKAESRTVFEWENVTRDVNDDEELSLPVTYDIQIATDDEFSNVVLERTGLTTSGYALLEEEALEPTKEETPYHWRVRAVDAASNVGDWTNPRTFYVSGSNWGIYALIGGGVLVIFFLGFWAGRRSKRSAYY
jgi:hypothetical protein